jgi:NTE family protein
MPEGRSRTRVGAVIGAVCLAATMPLSAWCDEAAGPSDDPARRPRVGLVLSGGGAKGGAHVGVLKVLEEQRMSSRNGSELQRAATSSSA